MFGAAPCRPSVWCAVQSEIIVRRTSAALWDGFCVSISIDSCIVGRGRRVCVSGDNVWAFDSITTMMYRFSHFEIIVLYSARPHTFSVISRPDCVYMRLVYTHTVMLAEPTNNRHSSHTTHGNGTYAHTETNRHHHHHHRTRARFAFEQAFVWWIKWAEYKNDLTPNI